MTLADSHLVTLANMADQVEDCSYLARQLCIKFGYDKVFAMTSGLEATDTTVSKLARGRGVVLQEHRRKMSLYL